mgnify:CR=1 FL=1
MRFPSLSWCTLALAAASALGVACSPGDTAPVASPDEKAAPKISAKEAKATVAQLNASANSGISYMLWDADNWVRAQGCAACHRGLPLYGAAIAYKNGLNVDLAKLDDFGNFEAGELNRWGYWAAGAAQMWIHDPTAPLSFSKGSFEFAALSAYNAYRSNAYQGQVESAIKWWLAPKDYNGTAYFNVGWNGGGFFGYPSYGTVRNGSTGSWTFTFPADGKAYAGTTQSFFPADWSYTTTTGHWMQMTGLVAAGISMYLNANPPIAAATPKPMNNKVLSFVGASRIEVARACLAGAGGGVSGAADNGPENPSRATASHLYKKQRIEKRVKPKHLDGIMSNPSYTESLFP